MAVENTLFNGPIPGQSLTQDPTTRMPYEMPPKFATFERALDHVRDTVSSPAFIRNYATLVGAERAHGKQFYVDRIASAMLSEGFINGLWTVDVMMLLVEPTIVLLVWAAAQLGESPRFSNDTGYEDRTGFEQLTALIVESEELSEVPPASPFVEPTTPPVQAPIAQALGVPQEGEV